MQLAIKDSNEPGVLTLGIQTNPPTYEKRLVEKVAHWKAQSWAPRKAKTYSILSLISTDYHGRMSTVPTGYATVRVAYFSTLAEGDYRVDQDNREKGSYKYTVPPP